MQHVLRGDEGGDLHPGGMILIFNKSLLRFKFFADIDEASPLEDEEAAQHALRREEGGDLHPGGLIPIFNKSLFSDPSSLQILMRPLLQKMKKLCNVLFMERK